VIRDFRLWITVPSPGTLRVSARRSREPDRANLPGDRDGGGKADKPDDRETGRRPHDLTPGREGETAPQTNFGGETSASASRLPEA